MPLPRNTFLRRPFRVTRGILVCTFAKSNPDWKNSQPCVAAGYQRCARTAARSKLTACHGIATMREGRLMAEKGPAVSAGKVQNPSYPAVVPEDPVEEASKESFPASDSPAWNGWHPGPQDPNQIRLDPASRSGEANVPTRTESDSMGTIEVPTDKLLRCADGSFADPFRHWPGHDAARIDPSSRHPQKSRGARKPGPRQTFPGKGKSDCAGGRRSDRRKTQWPFPAARLADRQRHSNQHECKRSDLEPGYARSLAASWEARSPSIRTTTSTCRNPRTTRFPPRCTLPRRPAWFRN